MKRGKSRNLSLGNFKLEYGTFIFGIGLLIIIVTSLIVAVNGAISNTTVNQVIAGTLILFGVVIGFLNISNGEEVRFLISVLAIVMLFQIFLQAFVKPFNLQVNSAFAMFLSSFFINLILLVVPAAMIVALKTIFLTAKDE